MIQYFALSSEVCFSFYFNFSCESFINRIVKITFYGNLTVHQWKEAKHFRDKLVTLHKSVADQRLWQSGPCIRLRDSEYEQWHSCSMFVACECLGGLLWAWMYTCVGKPQWKQLWELCFWILLGLSHVACIWTWVKGWIWLNITLCLCVFNKELISKEFACALGHVLIISAILLFLKHLITNIDCQCSA